jgi:hypothetical protein
VARHRRHARLAECAAYAFSGHRFAETYDHLADGVEWLAVGEGETSGLRV